MSNRYPVKSSPSEPRSGPPESGSTILVASKRTGVAMETLRAWERRYGFPKPIRKEGSNRRLYSDADLEHIRAVQSALARGYRIGDVVHKPPEELAVLGSRDQAAPREETLLAASASSIDSLIALLKKDDAVRLEDRLRESASALGPRRFVTDLAHPFVLAVGEAWAAGELAIRHEHLATEILTTRVRQMLSTYQDLEGRPHVLLATLPGEPHAFALSLVALFLAVKSARPRLLGPSTPPEDLVAMAKALHADVVGISVTKAADRAATRRSLRALRQRLPASIPIWLGGDGAADVDPKAEFSKRLQSWEEIEVAVRTWKSD